MSSTSTRDTAQRFEFHQPGLRLMDVPRDAGRRGRALECRLTAVELVEGLGTPPEGLGRCSPSPTYARHQTSPSRQSQARSRGGVEVQIGRQADRQDEHRIVVVGRAGQTGRGQHRRRPAPRQPAARGVHVPDRARQLSAPSWYAPRMHLLERRPSAPSRVPGRASPRRTATPSSSRSAARCRVVGAAGAARRRRARSARRGDRSARACRRARAPSRRRRSHRAKASMTIRRASSRVSLSRSAVWTRRAVWTPRRLGAPDVGS